MHLWRRINAAFIQNLIMLTAVLLTLQQDATHIALMLTLAAGAALAFRQRKLRRVQVLHSDMQNALYLLLALSYMSLHLIDERYVSSCAFNYFYVVGQYAAIVWLMAHFTGPFAGCQADWEGNLTVPAGSSFKFRKAAKRLTRAVSYSRENSHYMAQPAQREAMYRPTRDYFSERHDESFSLRALSLKWSVLPFPLKLLAVLAFMGAIVVLVGLAQELFQVAPTDDWIDREANPLLKTRVYSTWENPNILAGFLCALAAYQMAFLSVTQKIYLRRALAAFLTGTLLCLVYTFSRGFWVAMFVELLLFVGWLYRRGTKYFLGGLAIGAALAGPAIWQRLATLNGVHDTSVELRVAYLDIAKNIVLEYPLGIGWDNYQNIFPAFDYFFKDANVVMYHCHNMLLNITAELGVLGLLAFLLVWILFFDLARRLHKNAKHAWVKAVGRGYLIMSAGIFVGGLADFVYFNVRMGVLFWMLSLLLPVCSQYDEYN